MRKFFAFLLSLCLFATMITTCFAAEDSSTSISSFQLGEFSFALPDGMEAIRIGEESYVVKFAKDNVWAVMYATDVSSEESESFIETVASLQQKTWADPGMEHYSERESETSFPGFNITFALYATEDSSEKHSIHVVGTYSDTWYVYTFSLTTNGNSDSSYVEQFCQLIANATHSGKERRFGSEDAASTVGETVPTASTEPKKQEATVGQLNALRSASSYLRFSAFSYSGLVNQLKYEGYTLEEAQYAADSCGADWNEQAEKSARSYLEYTAFSYSGLIKQLEYEGFSTKEATYGVDRCGADWMEQAAKAAKSYLDYSGFSRSGLINQLEYEGFTHEQAVYGVEQNGL